MSKHRLLSQDLLSYSLTSDTLRDFLERMVASINDTQEAVLSLKSQENHHFQEASNEILELKTKQTDLSWRIASIETVKKAMEKIDAWSQRFTTLENKFFELSAELHSRVEEQEKQVSGKLGDADTEAKRAIKALKRDIEMQINECEEEIFRLRISVQETSAHKEDVERQIHRDTEEKLTYTDSEEKPGDSGTDEKPPESAKVEKPSESGTEEDSSESETEENLSSKEAEERRLSSYKERDEKPSVRLSSPTLRPNSSSQEKPSIATTSKETVLIQPPGNFNPEFESLLQLLEMRVGVLERKLDSQPRKSVTPKEDNSEMKLKSELLSEVQRSQDTVMREIAELKKNILENLKERKPASRPENPVGFTLDIKSIISRLAALESMNTFKEEGYVSPRLPTRYSEEVRTVTVFKDDGVVSAIQEHLQRLQDDMRKRVSSSEFQDLVTDCAHVKGLVNDMIPEIRQLALAMKDIKPVKIGVQGADVAAQNARLLALQIIATRTLTQNVVPKQPVPTPDPTTAQESQLTRQSSLILNANAELIQSLETRVSNMARELEKLRLEFHDQDKEMADVNQHFERMEHIFQGSVQRVQIEINQKMESIQDLLDRPADHPDASKNLVALRGVILKLQRDLRSLYGAVQRAPTPALEIDDLKDEKGRVKGVLEILQKHESQLKNMDALIKQVCQDLANTHLTFKKHVENQNTSRLAEMEGFKSDIAAVMNKVVDGTKLTKREYEKVNELYQLLNLKGDRSELSHKVDKAELRKAFGSLTKKIEQYREEIKRMSDIQSAQIKEEGAVTTKKLDQGCLACGQEVVGTESERDWRPVSHFPARGLNRYGHGFSKLLPIIDNLLTPQHRRGLSEAYQPCSSTDRLKITHMKFPEKVTPPYSTRGHSIASTPLLPNT